MNNKIIVLSISLVLSIGLTVAGAALAQGMMGGSGQGMMGRGMMHGDTMSHSMMQGGSPGMMGHGMMHGGMTCPMMGGMMQGSMMGSGMMGGAGGMTALFGSRVVPTLNLSVEDVRGYLTGQLDRLGNKRLKIGNINADGGFITADIATVDNSLVQRMKVNRSTGAIEYEN